MKQIKNVINLITITFLAITTIHIRAQEELTASEQNIAIETAIPQVIKNNRAQVADRLQRILANHYVLYTKTQKYHWNVEGKHFNDLHKFFGDLYTKQQANIDLIAERIRALGVTVASTLKEFSSMATLTEQTNDHLNEQDMIASLLNDYQAIIAQLYTDLAFANDQGDVATNNFLIDLVFQYEKTVWMLKALLVK